MSRDGADARATLVGLVGEVFGAPFLLGSHHDHERPRHEVHGEEEAERHPRGAGLRYGAHGLRQGPGDEAGRGQAGDREGARRPREAVHGKVGDVHQVLHVLHEEPASVKGRIRHRVVRLVENRQQDAGRDDPAARPRPPGTSRRHGQRDQHQHVHRQRKVRAHRQRRHQRRHERQQVQSQPRHHKHPGRSPTPPLAEPVEERRRVGRVRRHREWGSLDKEASAPVHAWMGRRIRLHPAREPIFSRAARYDSRHECQ